MSTPIENNTEELQELLRLANNLPEATDAPVFQDKTVSPTTEKQTVTPDPDYDGLSSVTVNAIPSSYVQPSGTKDITENGTHDVRNYEAVNVEVEQGVQLPELNNPGSASDLAEGVELLDADGKKVTGTLRKKVTLILPEEGVTSASVVINGDSDCSITMLDALSEDVIFSNDGLFGAALSVTVPQSEMYQFGDATEADVTAGKTFTSAAGVKKVGTATGGGSTPSAPVSKKDVNFLDYDGTVLYAYTVEEAQALTELPALPQREGLICQGWNYDLATIKSYNRAVNVGAMYITDDGTTRIYIHLEEGRTSPMLGVCPKGTVTVDWGDGTTPDTLTGTSLTSVKWTPTHNYAAPGDYVIRLTVDGTMGLYGTSTTNRYSGILRYSSGTDTRNRAYLNAVKKVELGSGVTSIGTSAFYCCYGLTSLTIPSGVTSIGSYAVYNCYVLTSLTIPSGVTSIGNEAFNSCRVLSSPTIPSSVTSLGNYVFYNCNVLTSLTIPSGVTSIGNYAFTNCNVLTGLTIPSGVTSIGSDAFSNCYCVRYYDFTNHTSVPTLSNTNAFTGIPEDCEIRVPAALYDEWIAATNWSTYASYIKAV